MATASQTAAGFSFLCLAGAAAWLVMSEFPIADPGRPTTSADPLGILVASVPAIGPFSAFDVNNENPFIPYQLRQMEIKTIQAPAVPAGRSKPTPKPVVDEPAKPVLPRLPAPGSTGPVATGIILSKDGPQALLTFPGEKNARVLKAGDSINGWTLVEIDGGNIARVKQDASGAVVNLVIPENLAPPKQAEDKAEKAGKAGKAPAGKQAEKQDKPGTPEAKPPEGKPAEAKPQDGAVPPPQPGAPEPKLPPRSDKLM